MADALAVAHAYAGVMAAVAKAAGVPELIEILDLELSLRDALFAAHAGAAKAAVAKAEKLAPSAKSGKAIAAALGPIYTDLMMAGAKRALPVAVDAIYRLAKTMAWRRAVKRKSPPLDPPSGPEPAGELAVAKAKGAKVVSVKPSFDLVDDKAIQALTDLQLHWVGDHWGDNLQARVAEVAQAMIDTGQGADDLAVKLGDVLRREFDLDPQAPFRPRAYEVPEGWAGSQTGYWEMLASNATTVARTSGTITAMRQLQVTRIEIRNPIDQRTCFAKGTKVMLSCGHWRDIDQLKVGDQVVTRQGRAKSVTATFVKRSSAWVRVRFGNGESIVCTDDHPLADAAGGWIEAGASVGFEIETLSALRTPDRRAAERIGQDALLLNEMSVRRAFGIRDVQGVPGRIPGKGQSAKANVLHGRLRAAKLGRRAARALLRALRQAIRSAGDRSLAIQSLLARMPPSRWPQGASASGSEQDVRTLPNAVPDQAVGSGETAALLNAVLPPIPTAVGAGKTGGHGAAQAEDQLQAASASWPLDRGLHDRSPSGGSRWNVLARQARHARARRAQDGGAGSGRIQGATDPRGRSGNPRHPVQFARGRNRVIEVERLTVTQLAYDIEVEDDHSFVVAPGYIVHNCSRCALLDGKVFTLQQASDQQDSLLAATSKDDVKAAAPWLSAGKLAALTSGSGHVSDKDSAALAAANVCLPPYHGGCRCAVDIAEDAELGADLEGS